VLPACIITQATKIDTAQILSRAFTLPNSQVSAQCTQTQRTVAITNIGEANDAIGRQRNPIIRGDNCPNTLQPELCSQSL
jgi:hypothetical protein